MLDIYFLSIINLFGKLLPLSPESLRHLFEVSSENIVFWSTYAKTGVVLSVTIIAIIVWSFFKAVVQFAVEKFPLDNTTYANVRGSPLGGYHTLSNPSWPRHSSRQQP